MDNALFNAHACTEPDARGRHYEIIAHVERAFVDIFTWEIAGITSRTAVSPYFLFRVGSCVIPDRFLQILPCERERERRERHDNGKQTFTSRGKSWSPFTSIRERKRRRKRLSTRRPCTIIILARSFSSPLFFTSYVTLFTRMRRVWDKALFLWVGIALTRHRGMHPRCEVQGWCGWCTLRYKLYSVFGRSPLDQQHIVHFCSSLITKL